MKKENAITAMTIESSEPVRSESDLIPFSELNGYETPLLRIPDDYKNNEFSYPRRHEGRCSLCRSPYRDQAELVYLRVNKNAQATVKFFERYYNAHITWPCVKTHMTEHCNFNKIAVEGLGQLILSQEEHMRWCGRENQLAMTILMDQIDQVQGLEISNRPAMVLDKAKTLRELATKLNELAQARDEKAFQTINIFEVLSDIYNEMKDTKSRNIVRNKIQELRSKL